jgi:hypothetical protein
MTSLSPLPSGPGAGNLGISSYALEVSSAEMPRVQLTYIKP